MKDTHRYNRHSIRMHGYDYTRAGHYFITICTHRRQSLFGTICDGSMHLNEKGVIVREEWLHTPALRPEVQLDEWVIMPNHLHAIVVIRQSPELPEDTCSISESGRLTRPARSLGSLVAGFKSATTRRINLLGECLRTPVWQRNYYDHVIRDANALNSIRTYIAENPARWKDDILWTGS